MNCLDYRHMMVHQSLIIQYFYQVFHGNHRELILFRNLRLLNVILFQSVFKIILKSNAHCILIIQWSIDIKHNLNLSLPIRLPQPQKPSAINFNTSTSLPSKHARPRQKGLIWSPSLVIHPSILATRRGHPRRPRGHGNPAAIFHSVRVHMIQQNHAGFDSKHLGQVV